MQFSIIANATQLAFERTETKLKKKKEVKKGKLMLVFNEIKWSNSHVDCAIIVTRNK